MSGRLTKAAMAIRDMEWRTRYEAGESTGEIAKACGTFDAKVGAAIKRAGGAMRTTSESNKLVCDARRVTAAARLAEELSSIGALAVPGFDCCFVTPDGRAFGRTGELEGWLDSDGYRRVNVRRNGRWKQVGVHQLVALTFLGPRPSPAHEVAHGDGVRTHNSVGNLRWATSLENSNDRRNHGTLALGEDVPVAKLTNDQAAEIKRRHKARCRVNGAKALAREYGVSHFAIHRIVTGKGWTHVQGEAA